MDFTHHPASHAARSLQILLLAIATAGCSTSQFVTDTAPRSTVSRNEAIALAKHVAASIDGQVYAVAPTGSMLPTLDDGSIVAVEKVPLDRLQKGDIVIYRNAAGIAVIHRLYECHGDRWFVLGDRNASIDRETVSSCNLLGRVCAIFYTSGGSPFTGQAVPAPQVTALASAY